MDDFQDPFVAFERAAQSKFLRGVDEHRGGDVSAPFAGCIITELEEETVDKFNYAKEMFERGMISMDEFRYIADREAECWVWVRTNLRPRLEEARTGTDG